MVIHDDVSKKCHVVFKKFFCFFWKFLSYLVCLPSFKSINSRSLSRQKYDGGISPPPRQQLLGQNTSLGRGLVEHNEPLDTLNYKPFFKHCILLFYTYFIVYICVEQNLLL